MRRFLKWLDEDLEETILMILLVAIAVVMMAQVVMRYFFRQSMSWPEEFCRFCFVYSGFISMGYCVRRGKMLKVDILVTPIVTILVGIGAAWIIAKFLQRVLDLVGRVVTLLFFAYLGFYAYQATMNSYRGGMTSPAMEVPMWFIYAAVLIGSALGFIRQIQDLYRFFKPAEVEKEVLK